MMTRADGVTIITTREQFAQRRAAAESQREEDRDDSRPHGIFIWCTVMSALLVGFVAGYLVRHIG